MKVRNGFVSNSSSSSFVITNKTNENKTIHDFAEETKHLVGEFVSCYDWHTDTEEEYLESAGNYDYSWGPGESTFCSFGDEDRCSMGRVCDYELRHDVETPSFKCVLVECRGKMYDEALFNKYCKGLGYEN